jgi:hypothetical protein
MRRLHESPRGGIDIGATLRPWQRSSSGPLRHIERLQGATASRALARVDPSARLLHRGATGPGASQAGAGSRASAWQWVRGSAHALAGYRFAWAREAQLQRLDGGGSPAAEGMRPNGRLSAYVATAGFARGTTGATVHSVIGSLYIKLGESGAHDIGKVFSSPEAQRAMALPLREGSPRIAQLEHAFWATKNASHGGPGAFAGDLFGPRSRDRIQRAWGSALEFGTSRSTTAPAASARLPPYYGSYQTRAAASAAIGAAMGPPRTPASSYMHAFRNRAAAELVGDGAGALTVRHRGLQRSTPIGMFERSNRTAAIDAVSGATLPPWWRNVDPSSQPPQAVLAARQSAAALHTGSSWAASAGTANSYAGYASKAWVSFDMRHHPGGRSSVDKLMKKAANGILNLPLSKVPFMPATPATALKSMKSGVTRPLMVKDVLRGTFGRKYRYVIKQKVNGIGRRVGQGLEKLGLTGGNTTAASLRSKAATLVDRSVAFVRRHPRVTRVARWVARVGAHAGNVLTIFEVEAAAGEAWANEYAELIAAGHSPKDACRLANLVYTDGDRPN